MTPFKKLLSYFAPYRRTIIFGTTCVLMTNLVKLLSPLVLGQVIDELRRYGQGQAALTNASLLANGGKLLAIALVQGVFLFTQRRVLINMSRHIEYDLRNDFYRTFRNSPSSSISLTARAT